jgi:cytochrome c553
MSAVWSDSAPGVDERDAGAAVKAVASTPAWFGAIVAAALSAAGLTHSTEAAAAPKTSVDAKIGYCEDCHGPAGQGYYGYFPIPRLAGQQTQYIKNQLQAFIEHRRTNNIMFNVAHVLSPAMISALAERFRSFNPPPFGGAPRAFVATGKEIFQDGLPDANIAACAACHGPEAYGHDQIPRLAGQLYPYLVRALNNWGAERGQHTAQPDTSATMLPIAHSLNKRQMEAVAAYVSTLK